VAVGRVVIMASYQSGWQPDAGRGSSGCRGPPVCNPVGIQELGRTMRCSRRRPRCRFL